MSMAHWRHGTTRTLEPSVWQGFDPGAVLAPTWLIDGLLPERSVCCVYGLPNTGKTFLALDMALCITTGRDWLGLKTRSVVGKSKEPGKVVYILGEGPDGLNRRIAGWLKHYKIERADWQATLQDRLFIPAIKKLSLNNPDHVRDIAQEIEAHCPDVALIVLDPLVSYMTGDENSARHMQDVVGGVRRLVQNFARSDCSALLVHHQGKGWSQSERGSSALRGGLETHLKLAVQNQHSLALTVEKQRDGAKIKEIRLRFVPISGLDAEGQQCEFGNVVVPACADDNPKNNRKQLAKTHKPAPDASRKEPASVQNQYEEPKYGWAVEAVRQLCAEDLGRFASVEEVRELLRLNHNLDKSKGTVRLWLEAMASPPEDSQTLAQFKQDGKRCGFPSF